MKSVVAFAVIALAAVANGQAAPPACANDCVAQTPTSCSQTDSSCLCHDNNFITAATQCILTQCKGPDLQAAESFAQQLCASVGVTLTSTPALPTSTDSTGSSTGGSAPSGSQTAPASQTNAPSGSGASSGAPSQTTNTAPANSSGAATTLESGFTGLIGALVVLFAL